jgi:hypothetical protein
VATRIRYGIAFLVLAEIYIQCGPLKANVYSSHEPRIRLRNDASGGVERHFYPAQRVPRFPIASEFKVESLVKRRRSPVSAMPVQIPMNTGSSTGIQSFQLLTERLDPVFQRGDHCLRFHHG